MFDRGRPTPSRDWSMSRHKFTTDGTLEILPFSFGASNADPAHRHNLEAECKSGRATIQLKSNRKRTKWYLTGYGPGLAGDRSRAINSESTSVPTKAQQWRQAIESGKVTILQRTYPYPSHLMPGGVGVNPDASRPA